MNSTGKEFFGNKRHNSIHDHTQAKNKSIEILKQLQKRKQGAAGVGSGQTTQWK